MLSACQGMPPTVVVVVTNTPDPNVVQITVTPANQSAVIASPVPATANTTNSTGATLAPTQPPAETQTPAPPTGTPAPTMTPTFFPTQTRAQLNIAQEDFEHGFMFWVQAKKTMWVLFYDTNPNNPNAGTWESYPDTFVDGEQESDPSLVPPSGQFQPVRGFGKIWRMPGLRDRLGWATTPEYALTTTYIYQPVGSLDGSGKYISKPGTHFVTSLNHDVFALSQSPEGDKGRWVRNPSS